MNCGSPIEKSETQINSSIVATNYSNTNNHIEKEATESINFTEEAKIYLIVQQIYREISWK